MVEEVKEKSNLVKTCNFYERRWNDPEQRNYLLHRCANPENTGGRESIFSDEGKLLKHNPHDERTYSCWYKNKGMIYRCFGDPEKIKGCPLAKQLLLEI